ncbi:Modification methylase FokI [Sedimentisphaera cyanobacteriorum]|uniref:site-specific DNA-methyltransferase (adenine-specific) n=1 Tax=Sedimentisphaera cyanobacteriorum TaxID=1940790 RepID=A0A1Q2HT12_9BACT|nr:DNA adenine methylase [Sedimentisphaera cyanobacteriorum]AQQ10474.1 Modification methylase FokI [Sedimentisphaera cyanobacteriorum]
MNYIGSKKSLLPFIEKSVKEIIRDDCETFCDIFAGTGIVGSHFKKMGYSIIANDFQYYSYALNKHYIGNHRELEFEGLKGIFPQIKKTELPKRRKAVCDYLSDLPLVEGFIFNNYSLEGTKGKEFERNYYSSENAKKCDTIRLKIEEWKDRGLITAGEYFFLITSLLENIDRHSNTASVYGAFLKKLKKSAQKTFELKPAELFLNDKEHRVYNEKVENIISDLEVDVLYLDPPYNQRQYAPNYHMLETIAKYDNPKIKGKTGLRDYSTQKSDYCVRGRVKQAFSELIKNAKARYIFLSYNNEGLMNIEEIRKIMSDKGEYGCFTQDYNRYKADNGRVYSSNSTVEYLHYCICR